MNEFILNYYNWTYKCYLSFSYLWSYTSSEFGISHLIHVIFINWIIINWYFVVFFFFFCRFSFSFISKFRQWNLDRLTWVEEKKIFEGRRKYIRKTKIKLMGNLDDRFSYMSERYNNITKIYQKGKEKTRRSFPNI